MKGIAQPAGAGQAAIIGQMTTGFPFSPLTPATFLLIGTTNVDLADHRKFTFIYAFFDRHRHGGRIDHHRVVPDPRTGGTAA